MLDNSFSQKGFIRGRKHLFHEERCITSQSRISGGAMLFALNQEETNCQAK